MSEPIEVSGDLSAIEGAREVVSFTTEAAACLRHIENRDGYGIWEWTSTCCIWVYTHKTDGTVTSKVKLCRDKGAKLKLKHGTQSWGPA